MGSFAIALNRQKRFTTSLCIRVVQLKLNQGRTNHRPNTGVRFELGHIPFCHSCNNVPRVKIRQSDLGPIDGCSIEKPVFRPLPHVLVLPFLQNGLCRRLAGIGHGLNRRADGCARGFYDGLGMLLQHILDRPVLSLSAQRKGQKHQTSRENSSDHEQSLLAGKEGRQERRPSCVK